VAGISGERLHIGVTHVFDCMPFAIPAMRDHQALIRRDH